ncbi:hypothetical protein LH425_08360 [Laribacter hongkongensis]|uniref:hypothetical protein n=1 Tax=Laribacter hongkongensis TaxID=168471 RepID=UPI001EFE791A|nr:hypothetical protein [Laribacter hongkongensis]MCG9065054.1 hypothetical protein [Laribacter hongkongensis]
MITVNGLNAGPSLGRLTDRQKNDHHGSGGQTVTSAKEKLHEGASNRSSRSHPLLSLIPVQDNSLLKSHIRIFLVSLHKTLLLHKKIAPDIGAARETRRAPSSRTQHHNAYVMTVSQSAPHHLSIDLPNLPRHHAPVAFNSATGIGLPIQNGGQPPYAAFFASVTYAIGASMVSMVGRSGGVLARAGSILPVDQPRYAPATPIGLVVPGLMLRMEATMPSFALRVFRALLSRSPAVSIIRSAADLAEARRMAADLISQDRRCSVRITAGSRGFDVEVAA